MTHSHLAPCSRCLATLAQVSLSLQAWFLHQQMLDPSLHVSEGYRGPSAQSQDAASGHSAVGFGGSAHNYLPAMAIDVFYLVGSQAFFPHAQYEKLRKTLPPELESGLEFPKPDGPHVQVRRWPKLVQGYPHGNRQTPV